MVSAYHRFGRRTGLLYFLNLIRRWTDAQRYAPGAFILIIGNKSDLMSQVSLEDVEKFCSNTHIRHLEVSAKFSNFFEDSRIALYLFLLKKLLIPDIVAKIIRIGFQIKPQFGNILRDFALFIWNELKEEF